MAISRCWSGWPPGTACPSPSTAIASASSSAMMPHWSLEEELQGAQHPTQFGQVLRDLGIGYIAAHSPQAKGRIERLWETLQDRLVAELRLHGITTVAAAEAYLPIYLADHNARFTQPPAEPVAAWRRPPRDLPDRLACRYTRGSWPGTTPSASAPAWSRFPVAPTAAPMPAVASHSASVSMATCWSTIREPAWRARRPRRAGFVLVPRRGQRLRASRSASAEGGRSLPLARNRSVSPLAALTDLAKQLRHSGRPHPWRRTFSRRQRERQRPPSLTT